MIIAQLDEKVHSGVVKPAVKSAPTDPLSALADLYDPSVAIKVIEVAKKYNQPEGQPMLRTPEYTLPGGPNSYHCSKNETAWTQGFFPGLIWLLVERKRLQPDLVQYTEEELVSLARRYQSGFEHLKRPSINHDQGFRFQLSYGWDYVLTGDEHAKEVMLEASESMVDRYSPSAGCIRSWDQLRTTDDSQKYTLNNMHEHYLVIIDNMMNLDMMYEATKLTGDRRFADIATKQAEKSSNTHIREDWTTYHLVNFDQNTGLPLEKRTAQGYADGSIWSRGQAWGIYGYAQCALRTGREDFVNITRELADVFLDHLSETGVPEWDFRAPKPTSYDSSAATITARGLQMLYQLLHKSDPKAAEYYLSRGNKLVADTLRECGSPKASVGPAGVDFGKDGWETILMHATINGNPKASRQFIDHGLVYADYYLVEFGNEAIKIQRAREAEGL